MFLLFAVFFTVGMLAYSGSSGLSTAVDESFKTGRAFVNFGYNVALVANSSREVAVRAFDIVKVCWLLHSPSDISLTGCVCIW